MTQTMLGRNLTKMAVLLMFSVSLSGCDYWPPALQTQIEQLRSDLQAASMEKTQLQNQVASMTKMKDDLQVQVEDLSRANRDKSSMINSLQNSLTAAQDRLAKSAKSGASKAATAKPSAKVVQKTATKKKPATRATGAR